MVVSGRKINPTGEYVIERKQPVWGPWLVHNFTSWPILVLRIDLDPAKCIGTGARNKILLIFKGSGWEQKWVCEIWSDSRSFESILNSSVSKV